MRLLKNLLRVLAYPFLMIAAPITVVAGMRRGIDGTTAVSAVSVAAALAVAALERLIPYRGEWNASKGDVIPDVLYAGSTGIGSEAARVATLTFLPAAAAAFPGALSLWPQHWPMAAQLALAFTIGELPGYWVHRIQHEGGGWLWRIHAPHHSVPRLYWLNSARNHPLDAILSSVLLFSIPVFFGAREDVLRLFGLVAVVHGFLQHSNIDVQLGPANYVLSMAEVHRWHHSRALEESNANYGQLSLVWDLVFGSRRVPADREPPVDTGLADMPAYPMDFLGQLVSPFRRALWLPRG